MIEINNDNIDSAEFDTVSDLIDTLLAQAKINPRSEFESVKLYGNSQLMILALKYLLSLETVPIKIGYIDFTSGWYDLEVKDEYVLEISEDFTACVQSAWNGNLPLSNEAKYTICMGYCSTDVIENCMIEGTPLVIGNLKQNLPRH